MNSELINRIPSVILEIIICWTIEFHRADAYERFFTFRASYDALMKQICEDIRMNTVCFLF